jgi:hypothetical protein
MTDVGQPESATQKRVITLFPSKAVEDDRDAGSAVNPRQRARASIHWRWSRLSRSELKSEEEGSSCPVPRLDVAFPLTWKEEPP